MATLYPFLENGRAKIVQVGEDEGLQFLSRNIGDMVKVIDIDEKSNMVRVEIKNTTRNTICMWLDEDMLVIVAKDEENKIKYGTEEFVTIEVSGISWNADTKEELDGVSTTVKFTIPNDEFEILDSDELEELIVDKISDISGFCHDGWDEYSVK